MNQADQPAGKRSGSILQAVFLLLLGILLVTADTVLADEHSGRTLVVGSEQDYPPFAVGMTDETAGGFTVELWKAIAAERDIRYTIRVLPFGQLLAEFKAGKIDVLINLAQSEERRGFAEFTVPHVIVNGAIFVRRGEAGIRSEADLAGRSVIVLKGDLAHDYALAKGWQKQLVPVATAADGFRLLASGKHDALLIAKLAGLQTLDSLGIVGITALDAKAGFSQKFAFAVLKGNPELLATLNEGLAVSRATGSYSALYEKWFGIYQARELSFRDLIKYWPYAVITLLLLTLLVFWVHLTLQKASALEVGLAKHRLETALNGAYARLWELDTRSGELWLSAGWAPYLGKSVGEQRSTAAELASSSIHPDDRPRVLATLEEIRTQRARSYAFDYRVGSGNGEWKWVASRSKSIEHDADGTPLRIGGINIDITVQKKLEEQLVALNVELEGRVAERTADLERNRERLQLLLARTPAVIWSSRAEGDYGRTYVSENVRAVLGYDAEQFTSESGFWWDRVHPEDRAALLEQLPQKVVSGTLSHQYRFRHGDGTWRWLMADATVQRDTDGRPREIIGYWIDVTARRQAEQALRDSEDRLQRVITATNDGIWEWNIETGEAYFSSQWCNIIGYASDDPALPHYFESWASRVHPDDAGRVDAALKAHLEKGQPYDVDYRHRHRSGEYRWQNSKGLAIRNESGKPVRMVGAIRDISLRKQAEESLRDSNRMKSEFIARMSHELRTPLNAILGFAELIADAGTDVERIRSHALDIRAGGERLRSLVEDILAFAELDASRARFAPQATAPGQLAQAALRSAAPPAASGAVTLAAEVADELPEVPMDARLARRALGHLLANAINHSTKGGTVTLSARLVPGPGGCRCSNSRSRTAARASPPRTCRSSSSRSCSSIRRSRAGTVARGLASRW